MSLSTVENNQKAGSLSCMDYITKNSVQNGEGVRISIGDFLILSIHRMGIFLDLLYFLTLTFCLPSSTEMNLRPTEITFLVFFSIYMLASLVITVFSIISMQTLNQKYLLSTLVANIISAFILLGFCLMLFFMVLDNYTQVSDLKLRYPIAEKQEVKLPLDHLYFKFIMLGLGILFYQFFKLILLFKAYKNSNRLLKADIA